MRRGVFTSAVPDAVTILRLVGVGQFFLTKAYASGTPTRDSVVGLSQVVFAMRFDAAIWGRTMTATTLVVSCPVLAPTAWLMLGAGWRAAGEGEAGGSPSTPRGESASGEVARLGEVP